MVVMVAKFIGELMYRNMRVKQRGFWNFVIPAVAAVASSVLSKKSSDKASQRAAESQEAANDANTQAQLEMNERNLEAQKEFAQHGISWKVADSKAAGLHPLFGAGLSGATFSPSFQVAQRQAVPVKQADDYSWLAQIGQLMGNYFGNEEAKKAQQNYAVQSQGAGQSVTITEHPGGGRTIAYPITGLESQVQGTPLYSDPSDAIIGGIYSPVRKSDPFAKSHINETFDKAGAFWQRFNFGEKFQVILPKTSEPQEVFEDKPLWFWAMVAKANVKEFGPGWLTQARTQFPSLREVWNGVVQELESSGILPSVRGAIPDILRR